MSFLGMATEGIHTDPEKLPGRASLALWTASPPAPASAPSSLYDPVSTHREAVVPDGASLTPGWCPVSRRQPPLCQKQEEWIPFVSFHPIILFCFSTVRE